MIIDGKAIASHLFEDLERRVGELRKKNIDPHLVVILVGNDPASVAYVRQKEIKTQEVGAKHTGYKLPENTPEKKLLSLVNKLNNDNTVHGVIVQLPLPEHLDENIALKVKPEKDIDAFNPASPYPMPLAKAVLKILENVYKMELEKNSKLKKGSNFINWMETKKIAVIGKGKTGGGPTIDMFQKLGLKVSIIDSKTPNPREVASGADILISAVGKPNIVTKDMVKKEAILVSVGMYRGEDGKLHGDYNEEEIKDIASYYTPVPGGVGPVNVACLVENLIIAAEKQSEYFPD